MCYLYASARQFYGHYVAGGRPYRGHGWVKKCRTIERGGGREEGEMLQSSRWVPRDSAVIENVQTDMRQAKIKSALSREEEKKHV